MDKVPNKQSPKIEKEDSSDILKNSNKPNSAVLDKLKSLFESKMSQKQAIKSKNAQMNQEGRSEVQERINVAIGENCGALEQQNIKIQEDRVQ